MLRQKCLQNFHRKRIGIVGYVQPTGNLKADFVQIAALLQGVRGRVPGNETPVVPRPDDREVPGPA